MAARTTNLRPIKEADKLTLEALKHATSICKENGMPDPNAFLIVEVAKLWISARRS